MFPSKQHNSLYTESFIMLALLPAGLQGFFFFFFSSHGSAQRGEKCINKGSAVIRPIVIKFRLLPLPLPVVGSRGKRVSEGTVLELEHVGV